MGSFRGSSGSRQVSRTGGSAPAHFVAAHRHGIDRSEQRVGADRLGTVDFHAPVFADQHHGEAVDLQPLPDRALPFRRRVRQHDNIPVFQGWDDGRQLVTRGGVSAVIFAGAEQQLYDTARDLLPGAVELDDTEWRTEFLYSRAASIYGGTAEVQRNIIARRLLDLGKE